MIPAGARERTPAPTVVIHQTRGMKRMYENYLNIVEAELGSLVDAINDSGGSEEILKRVFESSERVHYGRIESDDELRALMYDVIRIARPPILSRSWEEAWGNLFSLMIEFTFASEGGRGVVISLLYGGEEMPDVSSERILCVNPGSTSTKVALFEGLRLRASDEVHLPPDFEDGVEARASAIARWLEKNGTRPGELTGIACRGGFVEPVPSGTYEVVEEMLDDLAEPRIEHASNMAIPIGLALKEKFSGGRDILVTMTDPVATDEMAVAARLTGVSKLLRDGAGAHYLNHNAVHDLVSAVLGKKRDELLTIGAHLGGGVSIVRHREGRVDDLVNAFAGVPSANRSGNIPLDIVFRAMEENRISLAPSELSDEDLVCIDPAVVSLMAVREGHVRVGDRVAVFGLGAIGLMAVQMARISGATFIVGVEPIDKRRRLAEEYGADLTLNPYECDAGLEIKKRFGGVDVAIDTSGSYRALHQAIRATSYGGTIVPVSWYHGEARGLNLGEEWHFNRQIMVSGARVESEPYRDYPRWDRKRVYDTVIELFRRGAITSRGLLQPIVKFDEAAEAYRMIDEKPEEAIKLAVIYE